MYPPSEQRVHYLTPGFKIHSRDHWEKVIYRAYYRLYMKAHLGTDWRVFKNKLDEFNRDKMISTKVVGENCGRNSIASAPSRNQQMEE
ncbi:46313_t:CDS:1, partial [Gigaspora margarita]